MDIRFVGLSDIGLTRSQNQDAIFLPPAVGESGPIFVLADGMGGASGGEVASRLAVEGIPAAYSTARAGLGAEEALRQALGQAASAIHRRSLEQPQLKGMGTTTVALALMGERALVANVGDSRGYLWRDGRLMQVTKDHSLVQRMVAEGSLTAQEARNHHMRNVLTRVLGNTPSVEVDVFDLALVPGDCLLLCSDGLHGPVEDEEIGRIMSAQASLEEQAQALVELANRRGGPDNISVILVAIDSLDVDPKDATMRRTQIATLAPTKAAPGDSAVSPRRKAGPWLVLLALAMVGGGLYLWSVLTPAAPAPVQGKVLLAPIGPTPDSQATRPGEAKERREQDAPAKERRP